MNIGQQLELELLQKENFTFIPKDESKKSSLERVLLLWGSLQTHSHRMGAKDWVGEGHPSMTLFKTICLLKREHEVCKLVRLVMELARIGEEMGWRKLCYKPPFGWEAKNGQFFFFFLFYF